MKTSIWIILFFFNLESFAGEERTLAKSPRGLLMGDAYTSIADDEYTLFYNPAILARHTGFTFYPLNPSITATNILSETDRFSDTGSSTTGFAEAAFDFPVHIGVDYAPGFKMGKFALTALVNYSTNFNLQNKVTPVLDIDHRFDKGFVMGYAHPLVGGYTTKNGGSHLALGMGIKYIQRDSLYGSYNLTGYSLLDALSQEDAKEILNALGNVEGSGWGVDFGLDYIHSSGTQTFSAGLAVLDIYTLLHTQSNPDDFKVQDQPVQVNFGSAWKVDVGVGFNFTTSIDLKRLEKQMEFSRRLHMGFELGLSPVISVLAGLNAVDNYSYGMKVDLGLAKVYAGFYGTEVGEKIQQQDSKRLVIYLSLLSFRFDS